MDQFVRNLLAQPILEAEQERALARRCRDGDRVARAELITAGMRAVALRAMLCGFRGDDMRDAVQSGAVGLIRAVDRFDPDRGARLATYSWHWIGSAMTTVERPLEVSLDDIDPSTVDTATIVEAEDLLAHLPLELASVLGLRFGLSGWAASPQPRRLVAAHLDLTVAQVRQREAKAMRHLRMSLAKVVHRAPPSGAGPL